MANTGLERSFLMDKETYSKMVAMIEQAEAERQQAVEALEAHKKQLRDLRRDQGSQVTGFEKANEQISSENEELRNLCCFLDESRQKSKQVSLEWQSFGRYTAAVLKNETETFECKTTALQEQLDKLRKENKELREMCLILDKTSNGTEELKMADQEELVSAHTLPVAELNKQQSDIPHYTGLTSSNTLKDPRLHKSSQKPKLQKSDPEAAVAELRKRVDRLESEKLELVKSLSAAHLLATLSAQSPVMGGKRLPGSKSKVNAATAGAMQLLTDPKNKEETSKTAVPLEVICRAVTLLELTRQLDAAQANGYSDPRAAAEACTLRAMVNIAWQKTQEEEMAAD